MECFEIKELIGAWVDGETSPHEKEIVEAHLAGCPSCRALAGRMRALGEEASRLTCPVPPGFKERVFERLEREDLIAPRRRYLALSFRWAAVPLAAAAVLALVVLTAQEVGKPPMIPPAGDRVAVHGAGSEGESATGAAAPGLAGGASDVGSGQRRGAPSLPAPSPSVAGRAPDTALARSHGGNGLSGEEREIVANLELLEDPQVFEDDGDLDDWDLPGPAERKPG